MAWHCRQGVHCIPEQQWLTGTGTGTVLSFLQWQATKWGSSVVKSPTQWLPRSPSRRSHQHPLIAFVLPLVSRIHAHEPLDFWVSCCQCPWKNRGSSREKMSSCERHRALQDSTVAVPGLLVLDSLWKLKMKISEHWPYLPPPTLLVVWFCL